MFIALVSMSQLLFIETRKLKKNNYLEKPDSQNMVAMDTLNSNNYLLGPC